MNKIKRSAREAVIEAAFQLFNETPAASLAEIAARAGVGRATLHRHFAGRNELLLELAKTAVRELDRVVERETADAHSATEALRLSMDAVVPLADRHWFLFREYVEDHPQIAAEYRRQTDELAEAIDEAKGEGTFDSAIPTGWIAQAYDNLIFAAWEMVRRGDATPKQASALAWRTLVAGTGVSGDE